jgi:hypothetical protein
MVPEARLESTEHGLVARGEGWFVLNARDASWHHAEGRPAVCDFEGDSDFSQVGINISVPPRRGSRGGDDRREAGLRARFTWRTPTRYRDGWLT